MTDPLAEKLGINVQGGTVNVQNLNLGIAERLEQSGKCVKILVVAANPLGSSALKLDHEVKTIKEALKRSRNRDNFDVDYQLAATPSELSRALLDFEPHILHFSGHGAGEKGLLFVSDESMGSLYRSDSGEVRSRSTDSNEIKFVPAQPLANLLKLCEDHLECVVLNACYSDVQGNAISANIPFTIGMRDQVADHVAIKFSQGFYDAIGAGKSYEKAFEWGKVAISFDLADEEAAKILILREKNTTLQNGVKAFERGYDREQKSEYRLALNDYTEAIRLNPNHVLAYARRGLTYKNLNEKYIAERDFQTAINLQVKTAEDYRGRGIAKSQLGDKQGAILDYNEAIRLNPNHGTTYNNRGLAKSELGDKQEAILDYNEAIRLNPKYTDPYNNRGLAKSELGDQQEAILDYNEAIHLNPNDANAYVGRGVVKSALGDKQGSIADYNEAIRLNPNYFLAYYNRGLAKYDLGDKQGAIADFNEAIRFKPDHANAYYIRGLIKKERGEKQEALADFRKASELYQQQGNIEWYNISLNIIRELEGGGLREYNLKTQAMRQWR
jgi:tetratricopeptide (TPR) repeat protein